jgi:hypothetical protein
MTFRKEFNDPTQLEHYEFEVHYAKTKLYHMLTGDFVKYLFEGHVAKFTLQYNQAKANLEDFNNAYNNK